MGAGGSRASLAAVVVGGSGGRYLGSSHGSPLITPPLLSAGGVLTTPASQTTITAVKSVRVHVHVRAHSDQVSIVYILKLHVFIIIIVHNTEHAQYQTL